MKCSCCGEPILNKGDDIECACEWEGCDESCPMVGHLYAD